MHWPFKLEVLAKRQGFPETKAGLNDFARKCGFRWWSDIPEERIGSSTLRKIAKATETSITIGGRYNKTVQVSDLRNLIINCSETAIQTGLARHTVSLIKNRCHEPNFTPTIDALKLLSKYFKVKIEIG